jgi:hypothetical protein
MVRITPEIQSQMIAMRKAGSTYSQICCSLGVKKERCIAYLKDISPDLSITSAMTNVWRNAEIEARAILVQMGFKNIHDLNEICSAAPSWDYLSEKESEWWLIDVTINGQKSLSAKQEWCVIGYRHAILLKNTNEWKLIELKAEVKQTIRVPEKK